MFYRSADAAHRVFFALRPPAVLGRQIAHAAPWLGKDTAAVASDRLHVTMFILDDLFAPLPDLVSALRAVGDAIDSPPIDIRLDRVSGSYNSVALRPHRKLAALEALHDQLAERCAAAGIAPRANYVFNPHMTLGYRSGQPFSAALPPVAWTAREIVLIDSHLGRTRHEVLGCWPLDAADPQPDLFG